MTLVTSALHRQLVLMRMGSVGYESKWMYFLFLQKKRKYQRKNCRLRLVLLKLVGWLGLCCPNQPMPDFEVIYGLGV